MLESGGAGYYRAVVEKARGARSTAVGEVSLEDSLQYYHRQHSPHLPR